MGAGLLRVSAAVALVAATSLAGCSWSEITGEYPWPVCKRGGPIDCDRGTLDNYQVHLHDVKAWWTPNTRKVHASFALTNFGTASVHISYVTVELHGQRADGRGGEYVNHLDFFTMQSGETHVFSVESSLRQSTHERLEVEIRWGVGTPRVGVGAYVNDCLVLEGAAYVLTTRQTGQDNWKACDWSDFYDDGKGPFNWGVPDHAIRWSPANLASFPPPLDAEFWSNKCPRCYGQGPPYKVVDHGNKVFP